MKKVLFLCTHNSARSQIAEGWTKALFPNEYEVYSAGTKPTKINDLAIKVMKEARVDIGRQSAKGINQFKNQKFDLVVTLCDSAKEDCPIFPGAKKSAHHTFPDPSAANKISTFREVRDQIKEFVLKELPAIQTSATAA